MSGGTVRNCINCGWAKHCPKTGIIITQNCPEWKPRPDPTEKKPVAGCQFCRPPAALYQASRHTTLSLSTFGKARTLQTATTPCPPYSKCSSRGHTFRAEFIINFCPNCGRDLRGE